MTGTERRTTQRFSMRLPLTVRWTTGAAVGETSTESRDVSSRGVYFFLSKDVKEGSPVEILLTLPNEITLAGPVRVRCLGRVQRTEQREEGAVGVVATFWRTAIRKSANDANPQAKTPEILTACNVENSDEFLARSLRRRAGSAGVPWPLSEAPRLSFLRPEEEHHPERAERIRIDSRFRALRKRSGLAFPFFPSLFI